MGGTGAASVLQRFADIAPSWQVAINSITVTAGIAMAFWGLYKLAFPQSGRGPVSKGSCVLSIVCGGIMASMSQFLVVTTATFMDTSPRSGLSNIPGSGGDTAAVIVSSVLTLVALYGWWWAAKGFWLIHRSGYPEISQQGDMGGGIMRILGAIMCTNMLHITNLVANTAGIKNPLATVLGA